jgi:nicotinate-nucleotide adenylyltransferase
MKVGLYFGSFNPIHNGHLIIAKHCINFTDLQQIWIILSPQNPLKNPASLLGEYDRLFLIKKAIEGETNIKVSDVEFKLPKPSYTIDTLQYLEEKYPENTFSIILGSDSLQNISKWKNADILLKRYSLFVYKRKDYQINKNLSEHITILDAPLIEISSSYIRKLIQMNKSIRYLVPDSICNEIENTNFYRNKI